MAPRLIPGLLITLTLAACGSDTTGSSDTTAPSVTINQAVSQLDPTDDGPIIFTVRFSEPVTNFTGGDVNLAGSTVGGTLVAEVIGGEASYAVLVSGMSGTGTVVASIFAGAARDVAGNANTASTSTDNSVTFLIVNTAPTLDAIPDAAPIPEDAGQQTITLTGISTGGEATQTLTVTATSNNVALIPHPTVNYTSPNATGSLTYTPIANQSGSVVISVTVRDNGGTANGGVDVVTRTFNVVVTSVNDAPTLDPIADPAAILEDAGQQTITLTGISAGFGETQTLTVTATSNNVGLIPHPTVTYTSPNATGSLTYTPIANQSGSAIVTVTVQDNGGTANGGVSTRSRTFTVTVTPAAPPNVAPTLDPIPDPAAILEDAGQRTITLTGISAGGGETQTLTVTATSNNVTLIANPTVTYSSPNATGSLSYTPVANQSGSAVVTVTVQDNGGTANGGVDAVIRTFTVGVNSVNDAPTLDPIADPAAIPEDAGQQTVNLTGISAGAGEGSQTLIVTATSNNLALIPHPTVTYTSPNATGSLSYTPVTNQSGSAIITVTVTDNGGTANGGDNTTSRTFTVTVTAAPPPNVAPTLDPIPDPAAILEDAGQQTITLTGISTGGEATQILTVTVISSNPTLIPHPTVTYASPNATGSLTYTPVANQSGSAVVEVTVRDNGGTANGGVDAVIRLFIVRVNSVNDAPTLDPIADPAAIPEDAGQQTINLTGISAGAGEGSQTLIVTATSNNLALIPHPTVTYTSPNAAGSLTYTPIANQSGSAIITVTVQDNGGTANGGVSTRSRTFTVTVTPQVVSTVRWINPNGGDWNTASNWDTGVPTAGQEVIIDFAVTKPVTHSAGTTAIKSLTSNQPFTLSGGELDIDGRLQVSGMVSFTGGSVFVAGDITLIVPGDLTINSVVFAAETATLTLDVAGSISQVGGFVAAGTAVLNAVTGISLVTGSIANLGVTNTTSGDISITGLTRALQVGASGVTNNAAAGNVTLATSSALTLAGDVTVQPGRTIALSGATIASNGGEPLGDILHLTSVNGTILTGLVARQLSSVNAGAGNTILAVTGPLTIVPPGLSNSGGNVTLVVPTGDVVQNANVNVSGTITLDVAGLIFRTAGSFTAGTAVLSAADGISLSTGSIANLQALNTTTGDISIVSMTGPMTITPGGVESQAGNVSLGVTGNLTNLGTLRLGRGGQATVAGNFDNTAGGVLRVAIGGTAVTQFSRLTIAGSATLNGTLDVALVNGFAPAPEDRFQFMTFGSRTGFFGTTNLPPNLAVEQSDPSDLELVVVTPLPNGVTVLDLNGEEGSQRYFVITVPGASQLVVTTDGGTGDVDLYLRSGALPSLLVNDCSSTSLTTSETCTFTNNNPSATSVFILVHGFSAYSGVTLNATYTP